MSIQLLPQAQETRRPKVNLHAQIALDATRVHEACGTARRTFAMWLAGQMQGTVLWIVPAWEKDRLHPDGMLAFADPARFLFVAPGRSEDVLWCGEEALRAGAVPLVVLDLPDPPALVAIRRLHLAAQTGRNRTSAAGSAADTRRWWCTRGRKPLAYGSGSRQPNPPLAFGTPSRPHSTCQMLACHANPRPCGANIVRDQRPLNQPARATHISHGPQNRLTVRGHI